MISNLKNKYQNIPIQVKASFFFLICAFLQKGISFITTPIFTRLLSTHEYGQYNVFTSWMGMLAVLVTLNLYSGVFTRGLVTFDKDRDVFSSSLQGLVTFLVIIWFAVYGLFHNFWNQLLGLTTTEMLMMLTMLWTTAIFNFWAVEQRVQYKYKALVLVTILVSISKPLLGIILVSIANDKVTARIFSLMIVEVVAYCGFFFRSIKRSPRVVSLKFWKHALLFNLPLVPHYLSTSILNSADRIMISRMVSESAAGIYSLAYSVSLIMSMFNTALMQTIEPWMYRKIKDKQVGDISKVAYPTFILIALANILLIAFAPEVVRIFAPIEYYDAIYIIPPVSMSVFFAFSYTFFAVFEFFYEKTKLVAIATCSGAILNIILNYIFIKMYGYYAAGYTTLACYIIYALLHYAFMRKICNQYLHGKQPYSAKIYFTISFAFMAIGFVFLFSYSNIWLRYSLIGIFALAIFLFRHKILNFTKNIIAMRKI